MVYINPSKKFDAESEILIKIQIDNSLDLGWKKEDIILVTNFEYEYGGVKSTMVSDEVYCDFRPLSTKTLAVNHLLENGMINKDELYWVHDLDAYQLEVITEEELELGDKDLGLNDYGWSAKWCLGCYFFKEHAKDIFKLLRDTIYEHKLEDERALVALTRRNTNNINYRIKTLNITYGLGMRQISHNYEIANKPLRVIHFHLWGKSRSVVPQLMELVNERFKNILKTHGIN
jgi:hypothetical protein